MIRHAARLVALAAIAVLMPPPLRSAKPCRNRPSGPSARSRRRPRVERTLANGCA